MLEGPPTLFHPLALLHFVPGEPLDVKQPGSAYLAGSLLGRIHTILLREQFRPRSGDRLFAYLKEETVEVAAQTGLPTLLQRAVEAVEALKCAPRSLTEHCMETACKCSMTEKHIKWA